ncbi:MAG: zinc-ribbon domain-containing protein, partial [Polyangiales bacterium]
MITCAKCGKENQDHYKFCLGCGAELPRDAAPKAFSPKTPPHGMKAAAAPPPAPNFAPPPAAPNFGAPPAPPAPNFAPPAAPPR